MIHPDSENPWVGFAEDGGGWRRIIMFQTFAELFQHEQDLLARFCGFNIECKSTALIEAHKKAVDLIVNAYASVSPRGISADEFVKRANFPALVASAVAEALFEKFTLKKCDKPEFLRNDDQQSQAGWMLLAFREALVSAHFAIALTHALEMAVQGEVFPQTTSYRRIKAAAKICFNYKFRAVSLYDEFVQLDFDNLKNDAA